MSVSQERFEALVKAAAANHGKVLKVTVEGFGFILRLDARRVPYNVQAHWDQATDNWTGHDPYRGGMTLHQVVREVAEALSKE